LAAKTLVIPLPVDLALFAGAAPQRETTSKLLVGRHPKRV
jgi:hypothetical protein